MSGEETVAGALACKSHGLSLGGVSAVCLGLPECLSAWAPNARVSGAFGQGGGMGNLKGMLGYLPLPCLKLQVTGPPKEILNWAPKGLN